MAKRKTSTFERLSDGRLNRKQRRELERRLASEDPGLRIVHPNAGGIDVGNEKVRQDIFQVSGVSSWVLGFGSLNRFIASYKI